MYKGSTMQLGSYNTALDDVIKSLKIVYENEIHKPIFEPDKDEERIETAEGKFIKSRIRNEIIK